MAMTKQLNEFDRDERIKQLENALEQLKLLEGSVGNLQHVPWPESPEIEEPILSKASSVLAEVSANDWNNIVKVPASERPVREAIQNAFAETETLDTAEHFAREFTLFLEWAAFIVALNANPDKFTNAEIRQGIDAYLCEASMLKLAEATLESDEDCDEEDDEDCEDEDEL